MYLLKYHLNRIMNMFITPKSFLIPLLAPHQPPPPTRQPLICFLTLQISLHFIELYTSEIILLCTFFGLDHFIQNNYFHDSSVSLCVAVLSCSVVSDSLQPHAPQPTRFLCPWNFPGKHAGAGCHFLLQGIFSTPFSLIAGGFFTL